MATIQGFPNCCGASIFTGFNLPLSMGAHLGPVWDAKAGTYVYPQSTNDEAELYKYVMAQIKRAGFKNHSYFCILNGHQVGLEKGMWLRVLKKAGFEFVAHH